MPSIVHLQLLGKAIIPCRFISIISSCLFATAAYAQGTIESAKESTVRIEGAVQGSGVIINKKDGEYVVLTAWHVIKSNQPGEEISIVTHDGRAHLSSIKRSQRLGSMDISVIRFTSDNTYKIANTAKSVEKVNSKDLIFVSGYPNSSPAELTMSRGVLVANAEVGIDQGYQLLYESVTSAGMSGGPVFNRDYDVVGIHGRGELDIKTYLSTGMSTKIAINQGIPISFYNQFIQGLPVKAKTNSARTWEDYLALLNEAHSEDDVTGTRTVKKGRLQTAIRYLDQIIRLRPEFTYAWQLKGAFLSELDPNVSIDNEFTREALRLIQAYQVISDKARNLLLEGKLDASLAMFEQAVRFTHNVGPENQMFIARIYGMKKDYDSAIEASQKGLAIAANLYKRGLPIALLKPADGSISMDEITIAGLYTALAGAYMGKDDYEKAASTFDESIDILLSFTSSSHVKEALARAYSGRAAATLLLTRREDWACDYYLNAKEYGAMEGKWEELCLEKTSSFNQAAMNKLMSRYIASICQDRAPYEAIDFYRHAEDLILAVKGMPSLYPGFKSDSSLTAWAFTIAYKAYQACPQALSPRAVVRPDESWNYEDVWDQVRPRKN